MLFSYYGAGYIRGKCSVEGSDILPPISSIRTLNFFFRISQAKVPQCGAAVAGGLGGA